MLKTYRLLISGSSHLSNNLISFVETLGKRIIEETSLILLTGGLLSIEEGVPTVDFTIANAALNKLNDLGDDPSQRIMTLLPHSDWNQVTRFSYGNVITVKHADSRSRRYFMVHTSDAIITIEGIKATEEIIDLAWILEKPLLPLPFTGGVSEKSWHKYRNDIKSKFNLTNEEILKIESPTSDVNELANLTIKIIKRKLKPKCFVAMKFGGHPLANVYEKIREIAQDKGYLAIRLDQEVFSGNIIKAILESIQASDLVICDITGYNPNVLYELGISHALGKKTLILVYDEYGKVPTTIPFDIKVERILPYGSLDSLNRQLIDNI